MGVWSLLRATVASLPRVADCCQGPGIKTAPDTRGCLCRPLMTASRLSRQCYMASEPPSPSGQGPEPLRVSAMSSFTNTGLVHFCMVTFSPPEARPRFCVQGNEATSVIVAHFAVCRTAELVWYVSEFAAGGCCRPAAQPSYSRTISSSPFRICCRMTFLSNLPTLVLGISDTRAIASGNQKRGNFGARCWRTSCSEMPSSRPCGTMTANGRSPHFSSGRATNAVSRMLVCDKSVFSSSTEEIHSPPLLIRSLVRSVIRMYPSELMAAMSPVRNQPPGVKCSAWFSVR